MGKSYKYFWKKKKIATPCLSSAFVVFPKKKKKILANFPFFKITIFFFLFEGDIRVRGRENREKIE